MDVLICIPEEKIPKNNGGVSIEINFCGGHVCQVTSIDGYKEESLCFEEKSNTSYIIIEPKDCKPSRMVPLRINHVEEYYCTTEKMFFARCSDGRSTYMNLDEISKIDIFEE